MSTTVLGYDGGDLRAAFHALLRTVASGLAGLPSASNRAGARPRRDDGSSANSWSEELDSMDLMQLADLPMGPEPIFIAEEDGRTRKRCANEV